MPAPETTRTAFLIIDTETIPDGGLVAGDDVIVVPRQEQKRS